MFEKTVIARPGTAGLCQIQGLSLWERSGKEIMGLTTMRARRWTSKNTRAMGRKANREPAGPLVSQSLVSSHHGRILPVEKFEMLAESQAAESILRYSVPRNKFLAMQTGNRPKAWLNWLALEG